MSWIEKIPVRREWIAWFFTVVFAALCARLGFQISVPVPPDFPVIQQTYGWIENSVDQDAFARSLPIAEFQNTPAGQQEFPADAESYLWPVVLECWQAYQGPAKNNDAYPAVNQNPVGCCVGAATKHVLDILNAQQIRRHGRLDEWRPVSVEAIYAASRVELHGGRPALRGDGSNGSWAARAARDWGNLFMQPYEQGVDLSQFSPYKAREWGNSGVPNFLEPTAKKFIVQQITRINSWDDYRKSVLQGYPVLLCSNVGYEGRKDSDGFIRPNGFWPHAMAGIAVVGGSRPGGFILNNWGPVHKGPPGKGNFVYSDWGFWADATAIDRMCKSGDCWAFSGFQGFPASTVDWFIFGNFIIENRMVSSDSAWRGCMFSPPVGSFGLH